MKIIYFFLIIFSFSSFLHPTPRYVKAGNPNPVPPYLSWATASDSIQKCINVAQPGDTIFVGSGTYKEEVRMTRGLALIGAGWDSTIIDTRTLNPQNSLGAIQAKHQCFISGFRIIVSNDNTGIGISVRDPNFYLSAEVSNNLVERAASGVYFSYGEGVVRNNLLLDVKYGVYLSESGANAEKNIVIDPDNAGLSLDGCIATLRNNLVIVNRTSILYQGHDGISSAFGNGNVYTNNGFYFKYSRGRGIDMGARDTALNNSVHGKIRYGIDAMWFYSQIKNNSISGAETGYSGYSLTTEQGVELKYNNVWDCVVPYFNHTPDSTNIMVNPMYANPDSGDFHLQKFSPLINAGDSLLLDPDGTRSDIGAFGGQFGTSYTYKDLPPASPVNITGAVDSGRIMLSWNKNTEADFSHYIIYRDTVSGFSPDPAKKIGTTVLPLLSDPLLPNYKKLYYKIIAVDNQGLQSDPGDEISVIINGTDDYQFPENYTYKLFQNYPNPFNSSTTIRFRVQKSGRVALQLYTISGELLSTIVNREYVPGYYEQKVDFADMNQPLASGFYLIALTAYDERATVAFRDFIKIIYLK